MDGFDRGPAWCTEAGRPCADLWRAFWDKAMDVGLENIKVRRIPSHTTLADEQRGAISKLDRWGNALADQFARLGAEIHQVPPYAIQQLDEAEDLARQSTRWVAKALAIAHPDEHALDSPALHDLQADKPRVVADQLPPGPLVHSTRVKPELDAALVVGGERRQHVPKLITKSPPPLEM